MKDLWEALDLKPYAEMFRDEPDEETGLCVHSLTRQLLVLSAGTRWDIQLKNKS